jgi:hypothetical protein|tara:strand:+ start:317 stop:496 length:180 start_codon:yes stop_codon:yes gene_type:complete
MSEQEAMDLYDQQLDDTSSDISIGGCPYPYSQALKQMDPVAYRCGFADWASMMRVEGYY